MYSLSETCVKNLISIRDNTKWARVRLYQNLIIVAGATIVIVKQLLKTFVCRYAICVIVMPQVRIQLKIKNKIQET